ncbi:MAG: hypothetical protein AAF984_01540 [Verrucomicrobiota bacterium]
MKILCVCLVGCGILTSTTYAQRTVFGESGTGQPTNTVMGIIAGAAAGAAIGQATGGEDGWWIGSLVGSAVGGSIGNTVSAGNYQSVGYHCPRRTSYIRYSSPYSYRSRYYRSGHRYCGRSYSKVIYTKPSISHRTVYVKEDSSERVPYGHMQNGGEVRSPWSNFTVSVGGKSPGDVVYDANTGQAFRIP